MCERILREYKKNGGIIAKFGDLKSTRTLDMKYTKSLNKKMHITVYSDKYVNFLAAKIYHALKLQPV